MLLTTLAIATMVALGVRAPRTQASPWEDATFKGDARAALVVEAITSDLSEQLPIASEVFSSATYGTEISRFDRGLLLRTSFPVPGTGDAAVLRVDLDRHRGRDLWDATEDRHINGRFYVVVPDSGVTYFDGAAVSGELELEKIVVTSQLIAFRLRGWLDFVDPGIDEVSGTEDDLRTSIEIAFETIPPPEEVDLTADGTSPLPIVDVCEWPYCYQDPDYYYDLRYYDDGCGQATVSDDAYDYETNDGGSGCEGDPVDDGYYYDTAWADDGYGAGYDGGNSGCEGDTYGDSSDASSGCGGSDGGYDDAGGASSSGCDGDSSSSGSSSGGCAGDSSSSSSGCDGGSSGCDGGSSGCDGDAFGAAPPEGSDEVMFGGLIGWAPMLLLFGFVMAVHRRDG